MSKYLDVLGQEIKVGDVVASGTTTIANYSLVTALLPKTVKLDNFGAINPIRLVVITDQYIKAKGKENYEKWLASKKEDMVYAKPKKPKASYRYEAEVIKKKHDRYVIFITAYKDGVCHDPDGVLKYRKFERTCNLMLFKRKYEAVPSKWGGETLVDTGTVYLSDCGYHAKVSDRLGKRHITQIIGGSEVPHKCIMIPFNCGEDLLQFLTDRERQYKKGELNFLRRNFLGQIQREILDRQ